MSWNVLVDSLYERLAERDDEIERLRETLQWYADNCSRNGDAIEGPSGDYGRRAKCALDGVEFKDYD